VTVAEGADLSDVTDACQRIPHAVKDQLRDHAAVNEAFLDMERCWERADPARRPEE
jgi:hypothetical protein